MLLYYRVFTVALLDIHELLRRTRYLFRGAERVFLGEACAIMDTHVVLLDSHLLLRTIHNLLRGAEPVLLAYVCGLPDILLYVWISLFYYGAFIMR